MNIIPDTEDSNVVWLSESLLDPSYRITITSRSEGYIAGTVDEVAAWQGDGKPIEFDPYLEFSIKFDGCSNIQFSENLHLCGSYYWNQHMKLMSTLYIWAAAAIPITVDDSRWPILIPRDR